MDSEQDTSNEVGFPIRRSTDQRVLAPPRGFSQRATSFIASRRQGIHQMPLLRLISASTNTRKHPSQPGRPRTLDEPAHAASAIFTSPDQDPEPASPRPNPSGKINLMLECWIEGTDQHHPIRRNRPVTPTATPTRSRSDRCPGRCIHQPFTGSLADPSPRCGSRSLPALVPASYSPCPTAVLGGTTRAPRDRHRLPAAPHPISSRVAVDDATSIQVPGTRLQDLGTGIGARRTTPAAL